MHRRVATLLVTVVALVGLAGCGSGSSGTPSGGIQGGGNGSGDAAPGESQGGGGIQSGGLSGGSPGGQTPSSSASSSAGTFSAYDPVKRPLRCMRRKQLPAYRSGVGAIQVAPKGSGPHVVFASTPGDAQAAQIHGQAEGAEIIGNALLFVATASEGVIKTMEKCLDAASF